MPTTNTLSITFNEEMNTDLTVGTVSLNDGAGVSNGVWRSDKKTIDYTLSGLAHGKTYTVDITDFQDLAGNVMAEDNIKTFSTSESDPILEWVGSSRFANLNYGYTTGSSVTFQVKNTGSSQITGISASISTGGTYFDISQNPNTSLAPNGTSTVTVTSRTGLNAGTHAGTLKITWAEGNGSVGISQSLS